MDQLLNTYLLATAEARPAALRALISALRKSTEADATQVVSVLRRVVDVGLDYSSADALARIVHKIKGSVKGLQRKRLAVLGSFTTHQLVSLIELFAFASGFDLEIYEADYGLIQQEIIDPASELYEFKPDIVYIACNRRSLGRRPALADSPARVDELVAEEVSAWSNLWKTAHDRLACQVIQNNFDPPPQRALSNHEMRHHSGLSRFVSKVNHALQDTAPVYVTIFDVDHLSASLGRWAFGDDRFFYHAKMPCAPEFLVPYAHGVASIITAQSGAAKKCLVLDLDNTLWGGVIGDDGLGGIRLGQGEAEGEAFQAFQHYVADLARRGVILAVCSKNTESVAREAFEKHPEMVLRSGDIAAFVANWDDKATNLRRIAKQLEIGIDSLVFVDDNPMERGLVRQLVPEVAVPELPEDPAGYIQALDRHCYFQTVSIGSEDLSRTAMYGANTLRQQAEVSAGSIDDFLASLAMKARIEPVNKDNLERVVQLIGRSNQFNLTTRRHNTAAVLKMIDSPEWITRTVSLADRFGDNGLICVMLGRVENNDLIIDNWLMSCRVLKRGVESLCRNVLCKAAAERGLKQVIGEYIPTAKNALVKDHYATLGFQKRDEQGDGHTWWKLPVTDATPLPTFIEEL
jgi:FkbH-like protein